MTSVFEPPDVSTRPNIPDSAKSTDRRQAKTKRSTREKIDKMMADGAKNYPAYLKLIYTGDSEHSSEDETTSCADNFIARNYKSEMQNHLLDPGNKSIENSKLPSPAESHKLLDPGREKLPTPVEEDVASLTTNYASLYGSNYSDILPSCETPTSDFEDGTSTTSYDQKRLEDEWKLELYRLQDDISSLKTVLHTKLQVADDLKEKLGLEKAKSNLSNGTKHGFRNRMQSLKESGTFQKTNAAFKSIGAYACKKFDNIRKSNLFKSFDHGSSKSKSTGQMSCKSHTVLSASKSADSNYSEPNSDVSRSNESLDVSQY